MRPFDPKAVLLNCYNSIVKPLMQYGLLVYGATRYAILNKESFIHVTKKSLNDLLQLMYLAIVV